MVENTPVPRTPGPDPARESGAAAARPAGAAARGDAAAFQVLLEKLQAQARRLHGASEAIDGPEDLPGAIDSARETLRDALSLSDQLLEAYRQSQLAGPTGDEEPGAAGDER